MSMHPQAFGELSSVPPIILVVEEDADTRDMYSLFLESSGMWVATAPDPRTAKNAISELKPDLIVTDVDFNGRQEGLGFAHDIKHDEATASVPVVLLSGRPATDVSRSRVDADLFLVKPVVPDALLTHINVLLVRSRELRARNQAALDRAAMLVRKSNDLMERARTIQEQVEKITQRGCPVCTHPLQFVETGRIDGAEYDYYHWCDRGCGLYCYNRAGQRWVKLAG